MLPGMRQPQFSRVDTSAVVSFGTTWDLRAFIAAAAVGMFAGCRLLAAAWQQPSQARAQSRCWWSTWQTPCTAPSYRRCSDSTPTHTRARTPTQPSRRLSAPAAVQHLQQLSAAAAACTGDVRIMCCMLSRHCVVEPGHKP